MASYYVWSGATGSANGSSWANAFTTLATAYSGKAGGDVFFVAHDHAENTAATLTPPGTITNPNQVICVDRGGSVPPVSADRRSTASVTSISSIIFQAYAHYDGIIFNGATGLNFQTNGAWFRFDNCSLRITGATAGSRISSGISPMFGLHIEMNNTTVSFGAVGQGINPASIWRWRNTPSALLGVIPTVLFQPAGSGWGGLVECFGVDFSAAGSGKTLAASPSSAAPVIYKFVDCKLAAAVTKSVVPTTPGSIEVDFIRSGATGVNYTMFRHRISGALDHETTIVRTGGASDGTTPISWKVITTANAIYSLPFECPPIAIWCDTTGSAKTATIEGIWGGGAVPNDDDIWLDLEYLGDASSPQASFVNDGKADLLATAANQTTSTAVWGGTGATWDPATITNVTLSGGNLVATNTGTTSADQGARLAASFGKTSGKYYFEVVWTAITGGGNFGIGVGTAASTYTAMGGNATTGNMFFRSGNIYANGGVAGTMIAPGAGTTTGVAVDLDNRKIWYQVSVATGWNGSTSNNPATNVGGITIPAGTMIPFVTFGGTGGVASNVMTVNFGASSFVRTVPSGFTSGWASSSPFKLNVTFTPQQKGWVYARVKCAKASSTFYVDPMVKLS